jgi:Mannosyltransferase (PIG-V)
MCTTEPDTLIGSVVRSVRLRPWHQAVILFLVIRLTFFLVAVVASVLLNPLSTGRATLTQIWAHYDALHYMEIASVGYNSPIGDPNNTAFFPLFPLLIRVLSGMGLSAVVAGLMISTIASLVAAIYLFRLADEDSGPRAGSLAVLYLLFFPTAVYLCAPYTEALFLAGAIPAFFYARRGKWSFAAVAAAVATGTRVTGIFLLLGLFVEFLRQHHFSLPKAAKALASLAVGALPLVAYAVYLAVFRGNALNFVSAQRAGWGRELTSPVTVFLSTWRVFWEGYLGSMPVMAGPRLLWFGELAAATLGVVFTVWAIRKREWGYATYMGSLIFVVLVNGPTYLSAPRHLLALFPIPLFLAEATCHRPLAAQVLLAFEAPLATLGLLIYTGGTAWFY